MKDLNMGRLAAGILFAAMTLAGAAIAGATQYGSVAPDTVRKLGLSELVRNAESYSDQNVVATGLFYGTDADGDDFYLKDGTDIIEVAPPPDTPLMTEVKTNSPVAVYGKVLVRRRGDKVVGHMVSSGVTLP